MIRWSFILLLLIGCTPQQTGFDTIKLTLHEIPPEKKATPVSDEKQKLPEKTSEKIVKKTETPEKVEKNTTLPEEKIAKPVPVLKPKSTIDKLPETIDSPVKLKAGTYFLENNITITEKGALWLEPGTILEMAQTGILCKGKFFAQGKEDKRIVFRGAEEWENITVWGDKAEAQLQYCDLFGGFGKTITIQGKKVTMEEGSSAIAVGGALLFGPGTKGKIENCSLQENYGRGSIALLQVVDVIVANCEIARNDSEGIFCYGGSPIIKNNKIVENGQNGILCGSDTSAKISENKCDDNKVAGIMVREDGMAEIINNKCETNQVGGIILRDFAAGKVEKNEVFGNGQMGIGCQGTSNTLITENTVENNLVGIAIGDKARPTLIKNNIKNNTKIGIIISYASEPKVKGNTISDSEIGFLIHITAKPELIDNTVNNCVQEKIQARPR